MLYFRKKIGNEMHPYDVVLEDNVVLAAWRPRSAAARHRFIHHLAIYKLTVYEAAPAALHSKVAATNLIN